MLAIAVVPSMHVIQAQAMDMQTYVSGRGNDRNACTAAKPCLTLQRALSQTLAGGQISALNSANYGRVTIDKAVSILGAPGVAGVLATSSVAGITIKAGTNDVVNLRGLDIDGAGSGTSGIQFLSGGALNVSDSVIRGFSKGVEFQPNGPGVLSVSGTMITSNGTGIDFQGTASSASMLSDVQLVSNGTGLVALGTSTAAVATLTVQNSVVANNSTVGVLSAGFSAITVSDSTIANNSIGLQAETASALLWVSQSTVTGNGTGWMAANGGQMLSTGDNLIDGNTGGNGAPPTSVASAPPPAPTEPAPTDVASAPPPPASDPPPATQPPVQPPTEPAPEPPTEPPPPPSTTVAVSRNIVSDFGATCNGSGDDNAAFDSFNAWALNWQKTNTGLIELVIPSGSVCVFNAQTLGNRFTKGLKKFRLTGYGATLSDNHGTGNGFFLGSVMAICIGPAQYGQYVDGWCDNARTQTVSAGSTTITLKNAADAARFSVNSWAMMTGLDLQGTWSYPPNNHFFEYVYITAINGATITLRDPLKYTYKSTWPLYNPGSINNVDAGGPATLRYLYPEWDTEQEYVGLTIAQDTATNAHGRSITFRDCFFPPSQVSHSTGANPSIQLSFNVINCNGPEIQIETDKLVTEATWTGGTYRHLNMQSTSIDTITLDGVTITGNLVGGVKKTVIKNNSNIAWARVGAWGYGISSEYNVYDSEVSEIALGGLSINVSGLYTISNGVISSKDSEHEALPWAVPGSWVFLVWDFATSPAPVQILDVTQDNGYTRVHTSLTGGWPGPAGSQPGLQTHPAPKSTFVNATGSADVVSMSNCPANIPIFSCAKRVYSGNISDTGAVTKLWGKLVSAKINVTKPYTGAEAPADFEVDQYYVNTLKPSDGSRYFYSPKVNMKVAGERVITQSGVTGTQSGDSGLAMPEPLWIAESVRGFVGPSFSGDDPSTWPTVTLEIMTDQGITD
jgi:hypothetical protein